MDNYFGEILYICQMKRHLQVHGYITVQKSSAPAPPLQLQDTFPAN